VKFRSGGCHVPAKLLAYLNMLLRPAAPDDAIAVARVHVQSWQAAYRTLLPDDYLDQLPPEDRAAKYDFASRDPLKPRTIVAAEKIWSLGLPPRRRRAIRITASCAHSMWIPNIGAGNLALLWSRPLAPIWLNLDFETRCCGFWRATSGPNAFIELISGYPMAAPH
jgi:hypothetical protein